MTEKFKQPTPEEQARIQTERKLSDAEKIKGGANYVSNPESKEPRIGFTKEQVEEAREEAELRQRLVEHKEKLVVQLQEAIRNEDFGRADRLSTELQKHVRVATGEEVLLQSEKKAEVMETQGTPYEFVDMSPFIRQGNLQEFYRAGGQLKILKDAFDVEWVVQERDDDYPGEWFGVFKKDGRWHLVNGYFGSCPCCDDLEDSNPVEWLQDHVKNVRAFPTKEAAVKWLQQTEDYSYSSIKDRLIVALQ
jgi:hypothetical protein